MEMKEFEEMCRYYAEGAKEIEWVIATMLQLEYGEKPMCYNEKRTAEYLNGRDHMSDV